MPGIALRQPRHLGQRLDLLGITGTGLISRWVAPVSTSASNFSRTCSGVPCTPSLPNRPSRGLSTPGHPCGAPLSHPELPVQHRPKSRYAALRLAAGRSSGRRRAGGAASTAGEGWPSAEAP